MRDPFIMVVLIILIITVGNIVRAKLGIARHERRGRGDMEGVTDGRENDRLRDEVKQLKDRIAVLERITVEKENSLERQIEALRDR